MNIFACPASTGFSSPEELVRCLRKIAGEKRVFLQAFNSDAVLSAKHIEFSFAQAFKAFSENRGFSRSLENEWLLRAAATRSMDEAIKKIGVKDCKKIVLGIAGEKANAKKILAELGAKPTPALLKPSPQKLSRIEKLFSVRATPFYSLEQMLLEKIALVELER